MKKIIKSVLGSVIILAIAACGKKHHTPHFTVSKVFKSDTLNTVNVHIDNRITATDLLLIASKLKTDSTQLQNLKVCYLLPGNADITTGDNSYYASARLVKDADVKPTDTLKDDNGNVFRITIFGLSSAQAKHLLELQPKEIAGKQLLGRFIDDYNHTVIIPFNDRTAKKDEVYIVEVDSAAKVVSATVPQRVKDGNTEKWLVTAGGDYLTLKNGVLSQFGAQSFGVPFNSIKAGI